MNAEELLQKARDNGIEIDQEMIDTADKIERLSKEETRVISTVVFGLLQINMPDDSVGALAELFTNIINEQSDLRADINRLINLYAVKGDE